MIGQEVIYVGENTLMKGKRYTITDEVLTNIGTISVHLKDEYERGNTYRGYSPDDFIPAK